MVSEFQSNEMASPEQSKRLSLADLRRALDQVQVYLPSGRGMICWTIKLTTGCLWTWLTLIGANRSTRKSSSNMMFLTRFALTEPKRAITVRLPTRTELFPGRFRAVLRIMYQQLNNIFLVSFDFLSNSDRAP